MYYVYVLKGETGRLYVGRTFDLKKRLQEHREGKTWTTRRMGTIELIFYESFKATTDGIRRERYLKTSKGKSALKQIIRKSMM